MDKHLKPLSRGVRGLFRSFSQITGAPVFFSMGIKLNLNFFWKISISKKLPPEKPTSSVEICILLEFVKQNDNYSTYEADFCTDALIGLQDNVCKISEILVDIFRHSWVSKIFFHDFWTTFSFLKYYWCFSKDTRVSRISVYKLESISDWL